MAISLLGKSRVNNSVNLAVNLYRTNAPALKKPCPVRAFLHLHPITNPHSPPAHSPIAPLNVLTNAYTSEYVLYSGTGATLTTSGSRWSATMPLSCRAWPTFFSRPGASRTLSCAPRCCASSGVMMRYGRLSSSAARSFNSRYSAYAVSCSDFARSSCIDVSSKTERAPSREVRSMADGLEHWKPPAPGIGRNSPRSLVLSHLHRESRSTHCCPS